ncbi:MAG: glutamyl-tRNA amidotransferase [Potamolinea sp.]
MLENINFTVNGTLMQGLELNGNLLKIGAIFVCETTTEPVYRLWSIDDKYPAMLRVSQGGVAIAVEVWKVPIAGIATILLEEPPGLCIGKVCLSDGEITLGVLGEAILCETGYEITEYGGWRAYIEHKKISEIERG